MKRIKNSDFFFNLQEKIHHIPFTQSKAWYNYLRDRKSRFAFFVDDENDAKIATWGQEYKVPIIGGYILRLEGESYHPTINEKVIKTFYRELSTQNYIAIELNSNNLYKIDFEIGLRRAGFLRPYSLTACPLTIEVVLNEEFNFDRNWKRNVKKAVKSTLIFNEIQRINDNIINDIVLMFNEMAEFKQLTYLLEKESLKKLLSSDGIRTFIVSDNSGNPISARILHEHNKYLTDVFAANSNEARNCGGTYYMMDSILNLLKQEEKSFFDFGRIPPSNHATDSVYVFKNASRGRKVQYNGEFVFYKHKWIEYIMFIYKQFVIKKQRY